MIEGLNGRVINLLSFDMNRFNNIMTFLRYLWKGPVEIIVFGYFIYGEIGYYGFIGVGFILCFVPIQGMHQNKKRNKKQQFNGQWPNFSLTVVMGTMTAKYRFRLSGKMDSRIRVMNEIIQGIQIIKVYAWEKPFAKIVDAMRK